MKARLRMIRHGEAVPAVPGETDPGLSIRGVHQAFELPKLLSDKPQRLVTSPLIRARETALPLAATFGLERDVDPDFAELPWRAGQTAEQRVAELAQFLRGRWGDCDAQWHAWRKRLIERVMAETSDVVIVSHFVAINVLVGLVQADDRAVVVRPANASITEFHVTNEGLTIASLGQTTLAPPDPHLAVAKGFLL